MAATTMDSTTAGPAFCAAARPVSENRPAPIMAPIPSAIRLLAPSDRFSLCSPPSDSDMIRSRGLVANRPMIPPCLLCPPFAGSAPDEIDRYAQQHDDQPRPGVARLEKEQQNFNQAGSNDVQDGQDRVSKGFVRSLHIRPGAA